MSVHFLPCRVFVGWPIVARWSRTRESDFRSFPSVYSLTRPDRSGRSLSILFTDANPSLHIWIEKGNDRERSSTYDVNLFFRFVLLNKKKTYITMTDTLIDDDIVEVRASSNRPATTSSSSTAHRRPMYIETEVRTDTVTTRRMASAAANRSALDLLENTKSPTQ